MRESGFPEIPEYLVSQAMQRIKHPSKTDEHGGAIRAVEALDWTWRVCRTLREALGRDDFWSNVVFTGNVGNKATTLSSVSETRATVPQPVLAQLGHAVIAECLEDKLNDFSRIHQLDGLVLGVGRGGQVQDIFTAASQVLEVGRDRHDRAAIAIADIKAHHDTVRYSSLAAGLLHRNIPLPIVSAAIRLHRMPAVRLRVMSGMTAPIARTRALHTGALTAGMLARVTVEDAILWCFERWSQRDVGIALASGRLAIMSWSDNLFTFSTTIARAVHMQRDLEKALETLHHLAIKPSSREVMHAAAVPYEAREITDRWGTSWQLLPDCRILGPTITCNGSTAKDLATACGAIRGCYIRNARFLSNLRVPIAKRLQRLDAVAHGILRARAAAWPPCRTTAETLDRLQHQLLSWMLRVRPLDGETAQQYGMRKARAMAGVAQSQWSQIHLEACISWLSHLQRHPLSPAARAQATQDSSWVDEQRDANTTGSGVTRTNTRKGVAKVFRWDQLSWTVNYSPHGTRDKKEFRRLAQGLLGSLNVKVRQ